MSRPQGGGGAAGAVGAGRREGLPLLLAITLFWGLNWPAMKLVLAEVPVFTFRAVCLALGGLCLLAVARAAGRSLRVARSELLPLAAVAFLNVTLWQLLSAVGVVYLEAGRAAIIAYTMPLWASLLAAPLLGERLTRAAAAGLALGLAGLALLVLPEWRTMVERPLGPLAMLAASAAWAGGTVGIKAVRWTMTNTALTGWQLVLGGIPVLAGALLFDRDFAPTSVSAAAWGAMLYSILLPMTFCQWAWFKLVGLYPAVIAGIGTLAVPAVGVASGALILGEPVGPDLLLSLLLVCAALAVVLILPSLRAVAQDRRGRLGRNARSACGTAPATEPSGPRRLPGASVPPVRPAAARAEPAALGRPQD